MSIRSVDSRVVCVPCPSCHAGIGAPCVYKNARPRRVPTVESLAVQALSDRVETPHAERRRIAAMVHSPAARDALSGWLAQHAAIFDEGDVGTAGDGIDVRSIDCPECGSPAGGACRYLAPSTTPVVDGTVAAIPCPTCGAAAGDPCLYQAPRTRTDGPLTLLAQLRWDRAGTPTERPHPARIRAARQIRDRAARVAARARLRAWFVEHGHILTETET